MPCRSVSIAAAATASRSAASKPKAAELQSSVTDPQARAFYAARQWKDAWNNKSEKTASRDHRGCARQRPQAGPVPEGTAAEGSAEREAALTAAALKYASALASGYADPKKISAVYTIPRPKADVAPGLAKALDGGDLEGMVCVAAAANRRISGAQPGPSRTILKLAAPGEACSRSPMASRSSPDTRDQTRAAASPRRSQLRDICPAAACQRRDHYSPPSGRGGTKSLQARLGHQARRRHRRRRRSTHSTSARPGSPAQLAINMERLRWLERDAAGDADRREHGGGVPRLLARRAAHVDRRNVVAGEPDKQTPQLQAPFRQLVANPKWRVPDSIAAQGARRQRAPAGSQQNNFGMENGRYVQQSGPEEFTRPRQVRHGRPAADLPARYAGEGAVRARPNGTAVTAACASRMRSSSRRLLTKQDGVFDKFRRRWPAATRTWVKLKTQIPVRLLYHTAFLDGGRVQFRPDVYGWDDDVAMALGLVRGGARRHDRAAGRGCRPIVRID